MEISNIQEAQLLLPELIDRAEQGEEIILARAGKPVAKLVPYRQDEASRQGGQWRGRIRIAPDFDELPAELAEAFGLPRT